MNSKRDETDKALPAGSNTLQKPCHGQIGKVYAVIFDDNIKEWILVPFNCNCLRHVQ